MLPSDQSSGAAFPAARWAAREAVEVGVAREVGVGAAGRREGPPGPDLGDVVGDVRLVGENSEPETEHVSS